MTTTEWGAIPQDVSALRAAWDDARDAPSARQKLLVSLLHLPRRVAEEHQGVLEELIARAQQDDNEWVKLLGAAMNGFPSSGRLALHADTLLSTAAPLATLLEASRWELIEDISLEQCEDGAAAALPPRLWLRCSLRRQGTAPGAHHCLTALPGRDRVQRSGARCPTVMFTVSVLCSRVCSSGSSN